MTDHRRSASIFFLFFGVDFVFEIGDIIKMLLPLSTRRTNLGRYGSSFSNVCWMKARTHLSMVLSLMRHCARRLTASLIGLLVVEFVA
jgi:hypothetical protein